MRIENYKWIVYSIYETSIFYKLSCRINTIVLKILKNRAFRQNGYEQINHSFVFLKYNKPHGYGFSKKWQRILIPT